jgi:hypothetical protein
LEFCADSGRILQGFWEDSEGIPGGFWEDSGRILGGFKDDSGRILGGPRGPPDHEASKNGPFLITPQEGILAALTRLKSPQNGFWPVTKWILGGF